MFKVTKLILHFKIPVFFCVNSHINIRERTVFLNLNFRNKIKTVTALCLVTLCLPIINVGAKENFTVTKTSDKNKIVSTVLSNNMIATDISVVGYKQGQIGTFENGKGNVGLDKGLVISTGYAESILKSNKKGSDGIHILSQKDKDLNNMSKYKLYDVASVEFTLTNQEQYSTVLSFNYSFGSAEFDQNYIYNDCFGLFVDYDNDGIYDENIAKLPNGKNTSIMNIKNGKYFTGSASSTYKDSFNGISNVFTAETSKEIPKGGTVRLKFALADCSDNIYNSAVFIEGKSVNLGKKIENPTIGGVNMPNGTLTPKFQDTNTTCTYQWYIADEKDKEGKPLVAETNKTLDVKKDMVGKYIYLVVTGTGDYSGTGISNYIEIVDLPLVQSRFSYYTSFHYDEPYSLTCYGKGNSLDMYYIITQSENTPTPKEMISKGTKVKCNKTITKNGTTYSGYMIDSKLNLENLKDHIYVMFAKEEKDEINHSGIKDRQLYPMFCNANNLGFSNKEINVCNKIINLYDTISQNSNANNNSETKCTKVSNPLGENSCKISLCQNLTDNVCLSCSNKLMFKINGCIGKECTDYGYAVYNCNNGDLKNLGYNRSNIPCGEELLNLKGVEIYSLKDNNSSNNNLNVFYSQGLKTNTMNTDFIFAFWYKDNEGNFIMEKSYYENSYEMALREISKSNGENKEILQSYLDVYKALEDLCC